MLSVKYKGFVHHIAPDIDDERAKVIRDLNFAGCVKSVSYVSRPGIVHDYPECDGRPDAHRRLDRGRPVEGLRADQSGTQFKRRQPTSFRPGNHAFRYMRRQILTFRNDIWRANIIYGMYDVGRMAVNALRRQPRCLRCRNRTDSTSPFRCRQAVGKPKFDCPSSATAVIGAIPSATPANSAWASRTGHELRNAPGWSLC